MRFEFEFVLKYGNKRTIKPYMVIHQIKSTKNYKKVKKIKSTKGHMKNCKKGHGNFLSHGKHRTAHVPYDLTM